MKITVFNWWINYFKKTDVNIDQMNLNFSLIGWLKYLNTRFSYVWCTSLLTILIINIVDMAFTPICILSHKIAIKWITNRFVFVRNIGIWISECFYVSNENSIENTILKKLLNFLRKMFWKIFILFPLWFQYPFNILICPIIIFLLLSALPRYRN